MKGYIELVFAFIRISLLAFGGGYAILPVLEKELINKRRWVTMDEVLDYFTIAQITPGLIAVNVATFVGYKRKGPLGGIVATASFALPGIAMMSIISVFLSRFAEYSIAQHALAGIRLAVCALVLDTIFKLFKTAFKVKISIALFIVAFFLCAIFKISPVFIVIGAGIIGFFFYRPKAAPEPDTGNDKNAGKGKNI